MKWVELAVRAIKILSAVGVGVAQFGLIPNDPKTYYLRIVLFSLLVVSVLGDEILRIVGERRRIAHSVMTTALDLACEKLAKGTAYTFRANFMQPQGLFRRRLRIKYYSTNMADAPDLRLAWEKWQGCVGHAWARDESIAANLTLVEVAGGSSWGLTGEQKEKTERLKSTLSAPVRTPDIDKKTIGMLSLDSEDVCALYLMESRTLDLMKGETARVAALLKVLRQI